MSRAYARGARRAGSPQRDLPGGMSPRPPRPSLLLLRVESGLAEQLGAALVVGLRHGRCQVGRACEVEPELRPRARREPERLGQVERLGSQPSLEVERWP